MNFLTKLVACAAMVSCAFASSAFSQSNPNSKEAAAQAVVNNAASTLAQLKSNADFNDLLKRAKGVFP